MLIKFAETWHLNVRVIVVQIFQILFEQQLVDVCSHHRQKLNWSISWMQKISTSCSLAVMLTLFLAWINGNLDISICSSHNQNIRQRTNQVFLTLAAARLTWNEGWSSSFATVDKMTSLYNLHAECWLMNLIWLMFAMICNAINVDGTSLLSPSVEIKISRVTGTILRKLPFNFNRRGMHNTS